MGKEIISDARKRGLRIKQFRESKGLTQEKFAECLGVSESTVKKWERGENLISVDSLFRLNDLWGVSADFILYGEYPDAIRVSAMLETMDKEDRLLVIFRELGYILGSREAMSDVKENKELLLSIRKAIEKSRNK